MFKLKKGDTIKVVLGKDKGKEGKIEKVFPTTAKVLVPDVNLFKKHVKGSPSAGGQKGGIYDIPRPLNSAKVKLVCPSCKKLTRVGLKISGNVKVRVCKKCKKNIDNIKTSKK
jgi:large subunit ribosomal protein L24